MSIDLSLSCSDSDITRPLVTGAVEPEGIELTTIIEHPPVRHRRFFKNQEFDICEVSLASYLSSRLQPETYPFTAIPVFPSKKFRHSFFYKHVDSGIEEPTDLAGKKVGIQSWQTTANVWVRGIIQEHYDIDLEDITWYRRRKDDVEISIPDRFDIRNVPGAQQGDAVEKPQDLQKMLFSGDLDAAMDPSGRLFQAVMSSDSAEQFFDDPIEEEKRYFEETGIHPPMHVVAIRDEILEANPWVAVNVYDAFCEARDHCLERNLSPSSHMSLTWNHLHFVDQRRTLGPDTWEYGLTEKTRREVETFIRYGHEQGLVDQTYEPEDLFIDTTLDA